MLSLVMFTDNASMSLTKYNNKKSEKFNEIILVY